MPFRPGARRGVASARRHLGVRDNGVAARTRGPRAGSAAERLTAVRAFGRARPATCNGRVSEVTGQPKREVRNHLEQGIARRQTERH